VGDLSYTGSADVLSAGSKNVTWYENLGEDFSPPNSISGSSRAGSVYASDLTGDSSADFITASAEEDSIEWYRTRSQEAADLTLRVENVVPREEIPGDNGQVRLLDVSKNPATTVAEKSTEADGKAGEVTFEDLDPDGIYRGEVYHEPGDKSIFSDEYWGTTKKIELEDGTSEQITFVRHTPYVEDVRVFIDGKKVSFGRVVGPNDQVQVEADVVHGQEGKTYGEVKTRFVADRDRSGNGFDLDLTEVKSVEGDQTRQYVFDVNPEVSGTYYWGYEVTTTVSGEEQRTDGSAWGENAIFYKADYNPDGAPPLADSPMPMNRGGPALNNVSSYVGPERPRIDERIDIWNRDIYANSPSIDSEGYVYASGYSEKVLGVYELASLIKMNGDDPVWHRVDTSRFRRTTPLLSKSGSIYTNTYGSDGKEGIFSVSRDGNIEWGYERKDVASANSPNMLSNGVTIFTYEAYNTVIALYPDGKKAWEKRIGSSPGARIESSPAVDKNDNIYVGTSSSFGYSGKEIISIEKNGNIRWNKELGGRVMRGPTVYDEKIYVSTFNGDIYKFSSDGGYNKIFQTGYTSSGITIDEDLMYFSIYDSTKKDVVSKALAVTTSGDKKWEAKIGEGINITNPLVDSDGNIYFATIEGEVVSFGRNGERRWSINVGSRIGRSLSMDSKGRLYVPSEEGIYRISSDGSVPEDLAATSGNAKIRLSWAPGPDSSADGYNVYRSTSSFNDISNATKLNNSPISSTSYTDTEVANGTEYFYRVTAVDDGGNESSPSPIVSATPEEEQLPPGWELVASEIYENLYGYDYQIQRYVDAEENRYVLIFRNGELVSNSDEASSVLAWHHVEEGGFVGRDNEERIEKWEDKKEGLRSKQEAATGRAGEYWAEITDVELSDLPRDIGFWGDISAGAAAGGAIGGGFGVTAGGIGAIPGAALGATIGAVTGAISGSYRWFGGEVEKLATARAGDDNFDEEYAAYLAASDWLRSKGWDLETLTREQMEELEETSEDIKKLTGVLETTVDRTLTFVNAGFALSEGPLRAVAELLGDVLKSMAGEAANSFANIEPSQEGELYKYWAELAQTRQITASLRLTGYITEQLGNVEEIEDLSERPVLDEVLHDIVYAQLLYQQLKLSRRWSLALRTYQLSKVDAEYSDLRYAKTIQEEADLARERFQDFYQEYQSNFEPRIDNIVNDIEADSERFESARKALDLNTDFPITFDRGESEVYPAPIGFDSEGEFAVFNRADESKNVSLEVLDSDGLGVNLQANEVNLSAGEQHAFEFEVSVDEENAQEVYRPTLKLACDGCTPAHVFSVDVPTTPPFNMVRASSEKDVYTAGEEKTFALNFNSAIDATVDADVSFHVYGKKVQESTIPNVSLEKRGRKIETVKVSPSEDNPVGPYWIKVETSREDVIVENRVGRLFWVTPSEVEGEPGTFDFSSPPIVASEEDEDIGGRLQRALELPEDALVPIEGRTTGGLLEDLSGDVILLGGDQANPLVDRLANEGRISRDRWDGSGEAVAKVVDEAFPEAGVEQALVVAGYFAEDTFAAGLRTLDYIDETVSATINAGETADLDPVQTELSFEEIDRETEVEITHRTGITEQEIGLGKREKTRLSKQNISSEEGLAIDELWSIELGRNPEILRANACFDLNGRPDPDVEPSELVVLQRSEKEVAWVTTSSEYRSEGIKEQLCAVGLESFGDFVIATVTAVQPSRLAVNIRRKFGDASDPRDYRLVALPGAVKRPLTNAIDGEAGTDWQALWDDGSTEDYLRRYDGSEKFDLRPGRGFWLTSRQEWALEDSVETVSLGEDQAATVSLHNGWNIISNPFGQDVSWAQVNAAHSDSLRSLWRFDGSFAEADTFRSARVGEAFYFLNDTGLDSLKVPYPTGSSSKSQIHNKTGGKSESPLVTVRARPENGNSPTSAVKVGFDKEAAEGLGRLDEPAPPGRFSEVSLRLQAPGEVPPRRRSLMTERRPPTDVSEEGHTFDLRLQARGGGPAQITADGLNAIRSEEAKLLRPSTGRSYDLAEGSPVAIEEVDSTAVLQLAIGSASYVEEQARQIVPDEVRLTSYPNPARGQVTIDYTLPEAEEVTLEVYDVLGRRVATLEKGRKEAGRHQVDLQAKRLSSGVYFGRLEAGEQARTQKITVVR
jgi:hypothetical protein